ncbi:UDP-N-acetylmuramoyl-tripeptide--D-alanyl-D-alanine ligase [Humidesulfovibrio mexicanus]|uniref:UDP-N-acetylmuramoyl-tripeptide--D-alanyl-D-alanine ligase n=1 Tax=Humidesulfovibrio mexicanus TaxID=147047 RepID=A0A238YX33_9BACT|nr:UDP-N-acetylmuramoyl-tripeptide--D-alanyl-D-alanine ligase [Humidesulfovibrio mexicanus]SNR75204.1 UDP-N-acetylmuramoyl-tripeptide--D-alanyl-D-alanine ligase [Humidesulfovibrio mexicanus]
MKLSLRDVVLCLNGEAYSGPDADRELLRVCTDSRAVAPGDLFFCLRGERFDAHDFAQTVAQAGAACIVAARELPGLPCPVVVVDDTQKALGRLARCWRDRFGAREGTRVVAVTGTAGKTTLKELLAQTLGGVLRVAKNHKNFNNQIGLPLSILSADGTEDAWVMELGISQPGDMDELGPIIAPDLAVVLNIGPAHLQGLGDLSGVARAKASLLRHLAPGGRGLCCMDYPELWTEAQALLPDVEGFSTKNSFAKYYARFEETLSEGGGLYEVIMDGQAFWAELPACGAHFAENAAAVVGACHMLGLDAERIASGLAGANLPDQRFCCAESGCWRVVDDTYNANPLSMRRSIEAARLLAGKERLVLVLGDMKELGPGAMEAHRELGAAIAAAAPDSVFFQGEYAQAVAQGAPGVAVTRVDAPGQVLEALAGLSGGGTILVKGSRSCRMEEHAKALLAGLAHTGGRA